MVEGDLIRLAQALSNLLHNAAKYTPQGGRITLSVELEDMQGVIRVRDNGVGIPQKMLPDIFEMFVQGERSLDRSQGGLGIGLTLVRSLVEMHGGTVEAHSEGLGHGAEFVVRLPLLPDLRLHGPTRPWVEMGKGLRPNLRAGGSWSSTITRIRPIAWPCFCRSWAMKYVRLTAAPTL